MGKVYKFLGLSCAAVNGGMTNSQFREAFAAHITYVTAQQLGFSYLRDNTAISTADLVRAQPFLGFSLEHWNLFLLVSLSRCSCVSSTLVLWEGWLLRAEARCTATDIDMCIPEVWACDCGNHSSEDVHSSGVPRKPCKPDPAFPRKPFLICILTTQVLLRSERQTYEVS